MGDAKRKRHLKVAKPPSAPSVQLFSLRKVGTVEAVGDDGTKFEVDVFTLVDQNGGQLVKLTSAGPQSVTIQSAPVAVGRGLVSPNGAVLH